MKNDYFKYYKSSVLPILIGILLFVVLSAKEYWQLSISIFGIVSAIMVAISTYLWKYKPFIWLFNVDDFSGRYEGILKYQYRDESGQIIKGELKHIKLINQNGSRIMVSSFTIKADSLKSSLSVNKGMYVERTEDEQHFRLIYSYLNKGSTEEGFQPHYGTDNIKFIKKEDEKLLIGNYYTNRDPQTMGEIELKWVSNNLNHEF